MTQIWGCERVAQIHATSEQSGSDKMNIRLQKYFIFWGVGGGGGLEIRTVFCQFSRQSIFVIKLLLKHEKKAWTREFYNMEPNASF